MSRRSLTPVGAALAILVLAAAAPPAGAQATGTPAQGTQGTGAPATGAQRNATPGTAPTTTPGSAAQGTGTEQTWIQPGPGAKVTAVLQGLDKITARISTIDAPIDKEVAFGDLRIIARSCQKHPPEETPESAAFLEIRQAEPDKPPTLLFSGWMFASSPAVSALDNPVYDVWVLDCKIEGGDQAGAATGADGASAKPAGPQ